MPKKYETYPFKRVYRPDSWADPREKTPPVRQWRRLLKTCARLRRPAAAFCGWREVWTRLRKGLRKGYNLQAGALIGLAFVAARASILGELTPFIFALTAAFAYGQKKRSLLILLPGALGLTVQNDTTAWAGNLLALTVITLIWSPGKWKEQYLRLTRPLVTGCAVFVVKSLVALYLGVSYYQEMLIIFDALSAAMLTPVFLFCRRWLRSDQPLTGLTDEKAAACLFLAVVVLFGLEGISIYQFSVSSLLCRWATLLAAFIRGSGGGTIMGVTAGVIPALSSSVFASSWGMYAISGLLAGIFKDLGRLGCLIGFLLGVLAISFYAVPDELTVINLAETMIAAGLFLISAPWIARLFSTPRREKSTSDPLTETAAPDSPNRIFYLSQVFSEIGASFFPKTADPGKKDSSYASYLYDTLARELCAGCAHHQLCWRDGHAAAQELLRCFAAAAKKDTLALSDMPKTLAQKCSRRKELMQTVNHLYDTIRLNDYWNEKLANSRTLLSKQLQGMSEVVGNLAREAEGRSQINYALRDTLMKQTQALKLSPLDIIPFTNGSDHLYIQVTAPFCGCAGQCQKQWAPALALAAGRRLELSEKRCPPEGTACCRFLLRETRRYQVKTGCAQWAKEAVCGDSCGFFSLPEGKTAAVLSDGMGAGEQAQRQSQTAVRLLDAMLSGGFDQKLALETVNAVLLLRGGEESFATLDMLIVDLYTAEADVIKTAAAPSFFKRGRRVETVISSSLPVGILPRADMYHEKIVLMPGDAVIMVSDGVIDAIPGTAGEDWILHLLSQAEMTDCQALADYVLAQAQLLAKGHLPDDMTVLCLRLESL